MWIWYVSKSNGGNVAVDRRPGARGRRDARVFIKSSDGSSNYWSQFSPQLVAELHANGLKVVRLAVRLRHEPGRRGGLGAQAAANGADCLVIDAESEYEGHYAAAQTYISDLRAKVGPAYPLALATFPYVSYHPSLPLLGVPRARAARSTTRRRCTGRTSACRSTRSTPTPTSATASTAARSSRSGRPTAASARADVLRFREEAVDYGATGCSFWDWQETPRQRLERARARRWRR